MYAEQLTKSLGRKCTLTDTQKQQIRDTVLKQAEEFKKQCGAPIETFKETVNADDAVKERIEEIAKTRNDIIRDQVLSIHSTLQNGKSNISDQGFISLKKQVQELKELITRR
jgi:Spy/CpxP family protein refolding chaperone